MNNNDNSNFSHTINNKTRFQDQANPHHGSQQHNRYSSMNKIDTIRIIDQFGNVQVMPGDGNISSTDANGNILRLNNRTFFLDAYGNLVPISLFCGYSWTGLMIPGGRYPNGRYEECQNSFKDHGPRAIYVGADGWPSKIGTMLCSECADKNDLLLKCKKWTLGFYNPETF